MDRNEIFYEVVRYGDPSQDRRITGFCEHGNETTGFL